MLLLVCVALVVLSAFTVVTTYRALRHNIALAKALGLPYVVVPISMNNPLWKETHALWFPLLSFLPTSSTLPWIEFVTYRNRDDFWWYGRYDLFQKYGESILLVSPGEFRLYTASADVIWQVCSRRPDFPKPTYAYEVISIFGANVIASEGHAWRNHRKVTSPSFTEKSNVVVFSESLRQVQMMLKIHAADLGNSPNNIQLNHFTIDTTRMALHVISKAGFGIQLAWPGENRLPGHDKERETSIEIPPGHSLSFEDSCNLFLRNIIIVGIFGKNLLKYIRYLPFKVFKDTSLATDEWERYMRDNFEEKKREAMSLEKGTEGSMDLMGNLIKGAGIGPDLTSGAAKPTQLITNDEIISNAFILLMAGHETTANSSTFTAIMFAIDQQVQLETQKELDAVFRGRNVEDWNYETDMPALQRSLLGAAIMEQMRIYQPFCVIPKMVAHDGSRSITIDGRRIDLPAKMRVGLSAVAVHRNPKYWPHSASKVDLTRPNDLEDFVPRRWIVHGTESSPSFGSAVQAIDSVDENFREPKAENKLSDSSDNHFVPARGAYMPFSEGQRSCIGRRFALVEVFAIFAYLLSEYTIELDVGEWATEEEVSGMSRAERRILYQKAVDRARWILDNTMKCGFTLQLVPEHNIPLRVVKRGAGRFIF